MNIYSGEINKIMNLYNKLKNKVNMTQRYGINFIFNTLCVIIDNKFENLRVKFSEKISGIDKKFYKYNLEMGRLENRIKEIEKKKMRGSTRIQNINPNYDPNVENSNPDVEYLENNNKSENFGDMIYQEKSKDGTDFYINDLSFAAKKGDILTISMKHEKPSCFGIGPTGSQCTDCIFKQKCFNIYRRPLCFGKKTFNHDTCKYSYGSECEKKMSNTDPEFMKKL